MKQINKLPAESRYAVMDGRACVDVDAAAVMVAGSAAECCAAANKKTYGGDCLVVDLNTMEVCWGWIASGRWVPA